MYKTKARMSAYCAVIHTVLKTQYVGMYSSTSYIYVLLLALITRLFVSNYSRRKMGWVILEYLWYLDTFTHLVFNRTSIR